MTTFENLSLPKYVIDTLKNELKYERPSSIQSKICQHLKTGNKSRNLIAKAKNGSGKTLALTLLMLDAMGALKEEDDFVEPQS